MVLVRGSDRPRTDTQTVALVSTRVVGKRFHRITVEWSLDVPPSPRWLDAFNDAVRDFGQVRTHVPSAYGQPMAMHDQTIVWAMFERDARAAASVVELAVARANANVRRSRRLRP